jgi:3-deoxy-D-manno-octulosonic-acid transferase
LKEALRPALPCLVAGSSWPEDEAVLLPALAEFLKHKKMKLILVPHEPTTPHLGTIEASLRALDLRHAYFSAGNAWPDEEVLIVDQVGVLAELYAWGTFAFIGGSFRKSVHSVMEALGAGLMTFVGPFHENNREAMEFKALPIADFAGVNVVMNTEELREKMRAALESPQSLAGFQRQLKAEFQKRLGATDRLLERLSDLF